MNIRSNLLLLVAAALAPLLVFAMGLTAYSWWQERHGIEVRQLERMRAMTVALDTELQASIRVLRVLAQSPNLDPASPRAFAERLREAVATQPLWTSLSMVDGRGRAALTVDGGGIVAPGTVDEASRERVLRTRQPTVSGLITQGEGFATQVLVPVMRADAVAGLLVVSIEPRQWLAFLGQYPLAPGSIMTMLDPSGLIVARTLNFERWVGRPASRLLQEHSRESIESTFSNVTLEGVKMYSAHSRSVRWGWTLATGTPAEAVEASLFESTQLLVGAAVLGIGLAGLFAFLMGRRVTQPMVELDRAARALAHGEALPPRADMAIGEVREVWNAFDYAAGALRERERALHEALQREQGARREAEEAGRAKDEFLAMLGHELRNPLNAVTGAVAVMQQSADNPARLARARDVIARQLVTLRELVDDLLDVARVTSGKIVLARERIDLAHVARQAIAAFRASGRVEGHELQAALESAWVCGDQTRLEQVATNLLDNAAKFTPPGGGIAVTVAEEGECALLRVRDTGMGIPKDLLPRVFDLFTQGERPIDRAQGGLGLGLALVKRLVTLHDGRVGVESAGAGQGATFEVRLPLATQPAPAAPEVAPEAEGDRKLRILVVEDNPDGRETLAMFLGMQGHEVRAAEDGPAGVRDALAWKPDAAIVDIGLPGFDGYEVARRIRGAARGVAIRLVALTGYGQEDDRQAAFAAGFDSFLVKPADFKALSAILATV